MRFTDEIDLQEVDDIFELNESKKRIEERLKVEKKRVKEKMKQIGATTAYGSYSKLKLTVYEQSNLDMDAVRKKLSRQFLQAHTRKKMVERLKTSRQDEKDGVLLQEIEEEPVKMALVSD